MVYFCTFYQPTRTWLSFCSPSFTTIKIQTTLLLPPHWVSQTSAFEFQASFLVKDSISADSYRLEISVFDLVFVSITSVEGTPRDRNMLPFESFLLYLSTSSLITMLHCLQVSHINSTPKYLKWSEMLVPITDLKQQEPRIILGFE